MDSPLVCIWTGEAFQPRAGLQARLAAERFGAGEVVYVSAEGERSWQSHKHQWARIAELWSNLPETMANAPYAKSPETLRKHALIVTGFSDCETIDAGSKAAAERVAAYVGALASKAHGYCIVQVRGTVVRCWTPHSQSIRAMGAAEFQRSKTLVLDWIEALVRGEAA